MQIFANFFFFRWCKGEEKDCGITFVELTVYVILIALYFCCFAAFDTPALIFYFKNFLYYKYSFHLRTSHTPFQLHREKHCEINLSTRKPTQ